MCVYALICVCVRASECGCEFDECAIIISLCKYSECGIVCGCVYAR